MIRKAFRMAVHPGRHQEYGHRHDPIWPELEATLKQHGVHNYSIFLDERDGALFGYVEVESEERWRAIAGTPACRAWWGYMRDVMPVNADDSPLSHDLLEVFHLD